MKLSLAGLLLLSLAAGALAQAPPSDVVAVVRGAITPRVLCAADPRYSYALYLPRDYDPERGAPVLFLFDPRGRGQLAAELFRDAAALHGMVLVSSNDTRSDDPRAPNEAIVMALWNDVHARLNLDPRRHYAGGFSGGARLAARVGAALDGRLAGVILVGAGLPTDASPRRKLGFSVFGLAGEADFNYTELRELEDQLAASHTPRRVVSFEGGHEWMPPGLALEALDWLALRAIAEGRTASLPAPGERYAAAVGTRARALEAAGRGGEALRLWQGLAEDLAGSDAAADATAQVVRLGAPARKLLERERQQTERDREWITRAMRTLASLREPPPPPLAALLHELGVNALLAQAGTTDPLEAHSAQRRIAAVAVQARFYLPQALKQQGALSNALRCFELASALEPASPGPRLGQARLHAQAGRKPEALAALREAVRLGLELPRAELEADPELARLHGDAGFEALLKALPTQP